MSKKLVAYFSATGVTANVAKDLAKALNADLYEIKPQVTYTPDDLNWHKKQSRSTIEMHDNAFRPPLKDKEANIEVYDTILIGFPIWWFRAPSIINTFLESYDFQGKIIVLFATSLGSRFGKTVASLKVSVDSSATFLESKVLRRNDTIKSLITMVNRLGI